MAAKLTMTRQRGEASNAKRRGKDSGYPRIDELHAEKLERMEK